MRLCISRTTKSVFVATLALALLPVPAAAASQDDGTPARRVGRRVAPAQTTWSRVSECLDDASETGTLDALQQQKADGCAGISVSAADRTVLMHHEGATFNCCADISVAVERPDDGVIIFHEQETGDLCWCLCTYDLEAGVSGLRDGEYLVEVHDPAGALLCSRSVQIGPGRLGAVSSGCLATGEKRTTDQDQVEVTVVDDRIVIHHRAPALNCCLELAVEVETTGYSHQVRERDLGEQCRCLCPFELEIVIPGIEVGEHLVELIGVDGDTLATVTVTAP